MTLVAPPGAFCRSCGTYLTLRAGARDCSRRCNQRYLRAQRAQERPQAAPGGHCPDCGGDCDGSITECVQRLHTAAVADRERRAAAELARRAAIEELERDELGRWLA